MPESGVPRIPLNPNPLSEQIANSFGCDAGLRPIVLNGGLGLPPPGRSGGRQRYLAGGSGEEQKVDFGSEIGF